ncbi:hypothetical protein QN277_008152 [Acacia crassicarpa]|uniref:Helicase protein MOM1 n=1 Tax=Acacia crassicarpa TaxID=499986 RepID=A0AAE1M6Y6_9FABA|nr:hypothetical protein QN277_008152 [Acacia crassicarpa]
MNPSRSSTRKSERLGKSTSPSPPVRRKSQRVEKQNMPSLLRRSERTKNHSDIAPSGSKSFDSLALKRKKKKKHKSVKKLTFEAENKECDGGTSQGKRKRINTDARAFRAMIKKKPKIDFPEETNGKDNIIQEDSPDETNDCPEETNSKDNLDQDCPEETNGEDNLIEEGGNIVEDKIDEHFNGSNLGCKEVANNGILPSDSAKGLINLSDVEDRGETEATLATEIPEKGVDCSPSNDVSGEIQADDEKICLICKCGGRLLFCDGKECDGCYHFSCLEPPLVDAPLGVWHCHLCVKKKIELGVYSVSEGIESIWDAREVEESHANGWSTEKYFLVKYKGLAHVHNPWVSKGQLLLEAPPLLLEKFNQKDQALKWKPEWSLPHRLLQKRALIFAQQDGHNRGGLTVGTSDCHYEWLVKWHGLGYEQSSWELDNALFLRSLEGRRLIKDYEDYRQRAKRVPLSSKVDKKLDHISSFSKLSQTPGGFPPGFGINNLDAVNKLREHWLKGQNAVVFDDHDRMVKMVAFILSLDSNTCRPFLIISTSAALHLWEDEFSRWAPSLNVIIYSGNKEIRRSIRKLEFFGEGGCLLFQVLIVLPDIVIEDLEILEGIEFEAIIVDECQCSDISSYLKQIKMLKTDLWILILSGQLKDSVVGYHDILAFLDHQSYDEDNDDLISNSSDIGQLKDKLSSFVAYRCKSDSFRFVEYWVPVNISNAQLEQYCAALLSNSSILRSPSKSHVVEALHDILITSRKCCNHPYLVDESLQSLLIKDLPPAEILDVGIKASGKLQLLDSMLMELQKQGLRVLILFQFLGGHGKVSIGDILDDLIRQRFGPDSYERIDKGVMNSKKQSALKMFNNKDHGRFVFLLEANACHPSIKLSSVDTIIIFDSDWNPLNDIRSLQKLTLDSQLEQIKIFRLYSSFTVEERALVLAKQDRPLDSKLDISWSTIHTLLMWGASSLFDDLKAFHDAENDILRLNSLSGHRQSSLKQALHEFSSILKQNGEDNDTRDCSFLLKVKQNGLKYHPNFSLLGEWKFKSLDSEPCHLFWTKVLEGKCPRWKYSSVSSQRSRKRVQLFDGSGNRPDLEDGEVVKKHARLINNADDQPYSKRDGEKLSAGNKEGNSGESMERPQGNIVEFLKARKLCDEQRSLHLSLKSEIPKLCEILNVTDNVKRMADEFLEYVMNNHRVNSALPKSILEAFQISLCWTAAALVKHKIDHEASLMHAKQHLKFLCGKDEANVIYSMLRCLRNIFLHRRGIYDVNGSPKASTSELFGKNYSCMGLALEFELAKKDVSKSIKTIQKKCQKKLKKLFLKHQEEKDKLIATYEGKKVDLEKKYKIELAIFRSYSPNDVLRSETLKDLDIEYTGRIEDLKHQHEIHLKDLESAQLIAREMLQNSEAAWVEDVKSWADVFLNSLHLKERGNGIEHLKTSEQAEPDNDPKNRCLVSNLVTEGTNFGRIDEATTGTGDGSSITPEIMSPVAVQCSNPVEGQTPPVEAASAYECHGRAQNACDSRGKIISVHSHSKEHNVNGATCMMNEGEGHDIFNNDCGEKTVPDGSEKGITVDPPPSRKPISDESPLNVSDRELSSRQCEGPLLPDQQTSDGVSLCMRDSQVQIEVPETSSGIAECYNGRVHQTDAALLDQTATSEEQEQMSRTMNNNTLSQALQDSHASLLTSPRLVDKDAAVGEIQNSSGPVEQVSGPVDVIPTDQSNPESVTEAREQQLPSAEALASNQDTAGEMQISIQQVEGLSGPTDALQADQFNNDPLMEPLEQLQQLHCAEPLASNLDTSGELLNSSQQIEPVCCQDDVAQANGLNHVFRELLQPMQQLPPGESPNSTHHPSMATEIEPRSSNEDSVLGHVPPAPMEVTNEVVVYPASNSEPDPHTPVGAFRTQSLDTRTFFSPSEINNHLRPTAAQSMNRRHSPSDNDPLKNEWDRLRKQSEKTMKDYEDMKLRLKSDCEKELEEVRRKYDIRLHESEVEFQLKKKNLDTSLNLVQMNMMWAGAFRSKCSDRRASGVPGMQQDPSFTQQLLWYSRQQRDMRPPLVASPPHGPPASTLQHFATATSSQTMVPPAVSGMPTCSRPVSSSPMVVVPPPVSSMPTFSHPASPSPMVVVPPPVSSMPTFSHPASPSPMVVVPPPVSSMPTFSRPASSSPMAVVPPISTTASSQAMVPPPVSSMPTFSRPASSSPMAVVPPISTTASSQAMVPPPVSSMPTFSRPASSSPMAVVPPISTTASSQAMVPPPVSSMPTFSHPASSSPMAVVPPISTTASSQAMVPPPVSSMPTFSCPASSSPMAVVPPVSTTASSQAMLPPPVSSMSTFSRPASSSPMAVVPPISTTASSQAMVPPLRAAVYNAPPRPPHITSTFPLANYQAGSGFRTTPPHLRPSTSLPDPHLPTTARSVPSQQAPNNIPAMPSLPNHPQPPLPTNISDPRNRVHLPSSSMEPTMDGNCRLGMNLPNAVLPPSNVTSLWQSEFGTARSVQDDSVRPAMPTDVVCLSDDD